MPQIQKSFFTVGIAEVLILQRFPYGKDATFLYFVPKELSPVKKGDVVVIPWKKRKIKGVVLRIEKTRIQADQPGAENRIKINLKDFAIRRWHFQQPVSPAFIKLKPIIKVSESSYFSGQTLESFRKAAKHYFVSWSHFVLAAYLGEGKKSRTKQAFLPLMGEWQKKIAGEGKSQSVSGLKLKLGDFGLTANKYLFVAQNQLGALYQLIDQCLKKKKQVLVIAPEKMQTLPAAAKYGVLMARKLASTPIIISQILPRAWYKKSWRLASQIDQSVFIGNRSALFAPFKNLGLVILESGHDPSYKQWDMNPYYDLRELVSLIYPKVIKVCLSSTPRLEDFWKSPFFLSKSNQDLVPAKANISKNQSKRFPVETDNPTDLEEPLIKTNRLIYQNESKEILRVNLNQDQRLYQKDRILSQKAREELAKTGAKSRWTVVLVNHKGIARTLICENCGQVSRCPRCKRNLALAKYEKPQCPNCGDLGDNYVRCQKCAGVNFKYKNFGLEQAREELKKLFKNSQCPLLVVPEPKAPYQKYLTFWRELISLEGKSAVILGHAGLINCLWPVRKNIGQAIITLFDNLLFYPDFRSEEKAAARFYNLLEISPRLIIQTFQPNQEFFSRLFQGSYSGLYFNWIRERRKFGYPPFGKLIKVEVTAPSADQLKKMFLSLPEKIKRVRGVTETFFHDRNRRAKGKIFGLELLIKASQNVDLASLGKVLPIGSRVDVNPETFNF